jgi:hypothetical protein
MAEGCLTVFDLNLRTALFPKENLLPKNYARELSRVATRLNLGACLLHAVIVNIRTNQSIENRQDVPAVFHHASEDVP